MKTREPNFQPKFQRSLIRYCRGIRKSGSLTHALNIVFALQELTIVRRKQGQLSQERFNLEMEAFEAVQQELRQER